MFLKYKNLFNFSYNFLFPPYILNNNLKKYSFIICSYILDALKTRLFFPTDFSILWMLLLNPFGVASYVPSRTGFSYKLVVISKVFIRFRGDFLQDNIIDDA